MTGFCVDGNEPSAFTRKEYFCIWLKFRFSDYILQQSTEGHICRRKVWGRSSTVLILGKKMLMVCHQDVSQSNLKLDEFHKSKFSGFPRQEFEIQTFMWILSWRWRFKSWSTALWRREVFWKDTNVSEKHPGTIFTSNKITICHISEFASGSSWIPVRWRCSTAIISFSYLSCMVV
jgi:hypothetical protein